MALFFYTVSGPPLAVTSKQVTFIGFVSLPPGVRNPCRLVSNTRVSSLYGLAPEFVASSQRKTSIYSPCMSFQYCSKSFVGLQQTTIWCYRVMTNRVGAQVLHEVVLESSFSNVFRSTQEQFYVAILVVRLFMVKVRQFQK